MPSKTTLILLALILSLGLIYVVGVYRESGASMKAKEVAFAVEDTAAIGRILIRRYEAGHERESLRFQRLPGGEWALNDSLRAIVPYVQTMLETLRLLRVRESLSDAGQQKARQLLAENRILVEVFDARNKRIKALEIGVQTKDNKGTVMRVEGARRAYAVAIPGVQGYLNTRFSPSLADWRENLLFHATPARLAGIEVTYKDGEGSFALRRSESGWTLSPGGALADTATISAYMRLFKGKIYGETFANAAYPGKLDSLRSQAPDVTFSLQYLDDTAPVRLYLFERKDDRNSFFGYLAGDKELRSVQHFVFDPFLLKQKDFLPKQAR